uniref:Roadblock/LAMTOR2 domain-containing protein n=1 Tax=Eutreptiella gymnastica TaxID=73025 RepID=A0A7S4FEJ1_9EUGL|mmetsp:Transcript_67754/g.113783  ORF Transcript_67754/g.113783 Transcript_67754/m.113783 type:complete len:142 (+) Transcript_67754:91-516(+)|eukprot:CAMPEP_0174367304 /NCGR_PEP_ID=MMETSP0811_2-20130205/84758_1 /TAXON_ID=73025 ORGANISM="Eutreptiella gymnastica-like, Strain CCMP1594" /NCGR_SAMPLE_ID=MMETSP0811_2 /ASSEMBLY_ACC=CAM_ASM_000667 /LENGTH=141 /DNA_ID=CAMNT_0015509747 /DNA_START=91 /DNA_END=516 /DNA_ORIENTATION=+
MTTVEFSFDDFFNELLKRHRGLEAIVITDANGIICIKAVAQHVTELPNIKQMTATMTLATEQAAKLRMGNSKSILLCYNSHNVLQYSDAPLMVTLVGDNKDGTGNSGMLYTIMGLMQSSQIMDELKAKIQHETDMDDTFLA